MDDVQEWTDLALGVCRLARSFPCVREVAGKFRITCDEVTPDHAPGWAHGIHGSPLLLDTAYGEYGGALGVNIANVTVDIAQERSRLTSKLRRKHPKWTQHKIERAADQKLADLAQGPKLAPFVRLEREASIRNTLEFLCAVVTLCSITLVLDDGGSMHSDYGGTHGQSGDPTLRMNEAVSISASSLTEDFLLRFPFWVPVTVLCGNGLAD